MSPAPSTDTLLTLPIRLETDIVRVRQASRQIAEWLGFEPLDQTRVATAVSEIARNAHEHARGGTAAFALALAADPQRLVVTVRDSGPGIAALEAVLAGERVSRGGLGVGLVGSGRLMDRMEVASTQAGTLVTLTKALPAERPRLTAADVPALARRAALANPADPLAELMRQNRELMTALEENQRRRDELMLLNDELRDTNRGVVALYAELDEKAEHLRRADDLKSRFLSEMSHEFRTPLNSIAALGRLLLERADGPLTPEQERQVQLIRGSAQSLSDLVNDLLDTAKVEAGKVEVRNAPFEVGELMGTLRGMLRPLLVSDSVTLTIEEPAKPLVIVSDEAKVGQILRNFLANAIKYTEAGEIRAVAEIVPATGEGPGLVRFRVVDSGIGIAPEDQARIFEDFVQIDSRRQRRVQGTGLGLPLSRRLAHLLGGEVAVESVPGRGSSFSLTLPLATPPTPAPLPPGTPSVLVLEDEHVDMLVATRLLGELGIAVQPAGSVYEARIALEQQLPLALVLDMTLLSDTAWRFLLQLRHDPQTAPLPVLVASNQPDGTRALAAGADVFLRKPLDRRTLVSTLARLIGGERALLVLHLDPNAERRDRVARLLEGSGRALVQAATAEAAEAALGETSPDVLLVALETDGEPGYRFSRRAQGGPPCVVLAAGPASAVRPPGAATVLREEGLDRDMLLDAIDAAALSPRRLAPGGARP